MLTACQELQWRGGGGGLLHLIQLWIPDELFP
jgi:hypothetical protein